MNHEQTFQQFFDSIHMDNTEEYDDTIASITKILNRNYYEDLEDTDSTYMHVVGSVGRTTAVHDTSDLDLLYELPANLKNNFVNDNDSKSNRPSQLLQQVKKVLLDRYPSTDVKGDGQAVVISFTDRRFTIDLVPGFRNSDDSFTFPDTHDGGSWPKTMPFPEQEACKTSDKDTNGAFHRISNLLRIWKDQVGFKFGGLLIDTLSKKYCDNNEDASNTKFADYYDFILDIFDFLSKENQDQAYWYALGSNQEVKNSGQGRFVREAKKAHKKLSKADSETEKEDSLIELLGKRFKDQIVDSESKSRSLAFYNKYKPENHENFISKRFPINIKYSLQINCRVTQDGFRPDLLSNILAQNKYLAHKKQPTFFIESNNVERPYKVYWKVRNRGEWAYRQNCLRGQIIQDDGNEEIYEHADFDGPHYVECYIIKNGICVARNRISVPIKDNK